MYLGSYRADLVSCHLMTLRLRTQLLIGLATLVCILLAGAAVFFVSQIGPGALSKLPAGRTLAVAVGLSDNERDRLATFIPEVQRIPSLNAAFPVAALIRGNDGTATWVTFDARGNAQGGQVMLQKGESSLTSDPAFRGLDSTYKPGTGWVYLRFPVITSEIPGIRSIAKPVSIAFGTGSTRVSWQSTSPISTLATVHELPATDIDLALSVHAGNLKLFLQSAASLLNDNSALAVQSLLTGWVTRLAGSDVSARYEVLPLLDGPGGLTLIHSSGAMQAALTSGTQTDPTETLAHMHRGVASTNVGSTRFTRTFDETFSIDTLTEDAAAVTLEGKQGNWRILRTAIADGRGLFSAETGKRIILSVSDTLLSRLLNASSVLGSPSLVARGHADMPSVRAWIDSLHLSIAFPVQILPMQQERIEWEIVKKGGVLTLELK